MASLSSSSSSKGSYSSKSTSKVHEFFAFSFSLVAWSGVILRAIFLAYGAWHDASSINVPYTDVDYYVFSDAAKFVAAGGSPYERATYRYAPTLAYLMLPNVYVWKHFGKVLFSAADVAVGYLLYALQRT